MALEARTHQNSKNTWANLSGKSRGFRWKQTRQVHTTNILSYTLLLSKKSQIQFLPL